MPDHTSSARYGAAPAAGSGTSAASAPPDRRAHLRRLREIFDRRAPGFAEVAFLPREIAQRMHERLDYIKVTPQRVLDVGCGAGADLQPLRERFTDAAVYGVDLSLRMLRQRDAGPERAANSGWRRLMPSQWLRGKHAQSDAVQADFSTLPFASGAFDLLWSNLALHWHARPDTVFPEWQRVLSTGGLLMFSTLGPDTLRELRAAWQVADLARRGAQAHRAAHVLDFVDMHDFGDMLVASGFEIPVMDMETLTITYKSPESLLADVRRWGALPSLGTTGGASQAGLGVESAGLTSRGAYRALLDALERQRQPDGTIPLTFEVVYGHAWKAAQRATPEGHAIVRVEDIVRAKPKS